MGSEGGRMGYMSGGTTWSDTGKKRLARLEKHQRGKLVSVKHLNKANIGPKTFMDGPAGAQRRAAANRLRQVLTRKFGKSKGWGSGRGPANVRVSWGRDKGWAKPSHNADGTIRADGAAGRRFLRGLANTAAKRAGLRKEGITVGTVTKSKLVNAKGETVWEMKGLVRATPGTR